MEHHHQRKYEYDAWPVDVLYVHRRRMLGALFLPLYVWDTPGSQLSS